MNILSDYLKAGILVACLLLSGCGGESYTFEPDHELKPGPGIFSGEDGEFTLIGSPKNKEGKEEQKPKEQEKE